MSEEAMKRLTITLPEDLVLALEDMAEETDTSVSDAAREAIRSYLIDTVWKSIGELAKEGLVGGKTNEEVLADVLKRYPDASTSLKSIAWYRSRLRKELGTDQVMTDAGVRRARSAG